MLEKFEEVTVNSKRWFDTQDFLKEKWKDIENFNGFYQISNYGRVKSLYMWNGHIYKKRSKPKILKCSKQDTIYTNTIYSRYKVKLCYNMRKDYLVHRLVARAFIPNPNNLPQVNHKDGNALNNRIDNLEWCTAEDNIQHSYKISRIKNKKYNEDKILFMIKNNIRPMIILKENCISKIVYYRILKKNNIKPQGNKYWKNKYNINLNTLKEDFDKGFNNKELAMKYKTNNNLIAKYRQKYKKGEI